MSSIDEELWNVFTYYAMHHNPREATRLYSAGLTKLCRDINLMNSTHTERPIMQAEIHLLFKAEVLKKSPSKLKQGSTEGKDKLSYEDFLSVLTKLALKCYPSCKTADEALQQILMDNLLPLALRRKPVSIQAFLNLPAIENLFNYYEDAIFELFRFFSSVGADRAKVTSLIKTTSAFSVTFDEHLEQVEGNKISEEVASHSTKIYNPSRQMAFPDFVKFSNDFGLTIRYGSYIFKSETNACI